MYQDIEDLAVADEYWKAGLLHLRVINVRDGGCASAWLHIADYKTFYDGSDNSDISPSKWESGPGTRAAYAIIAED